MSRDMLVALVVLGAMVAYQEFESRVIVPRVYGRALRWSSAVVVIALLIGGKAAAVATDIANQTREADPARGKAPAETPLT